MAPARWTWRRWGHQQALANAREATIELSRARVERAEVELYLARRRELEEAVAVAERA
jgi:hypothetical protein